MLTRLDNPAAIRTAIYRLTQNAGGTQQPVFLHAATVEEIFAQVKQTLAHIPLEDGNALEHLAAASMPHWTPPGILSMNPHGQVEVVPSLKSNTHTHIDIWYLTPGEPSYILVSLSFELPGTVVWDIARQLTLALQKGRELSF